MNLKRAFISYISSHNFSHKEILQWDNEESIAIFAGQEQVGLNNNTENKFLNKPIA